MKLFGLTIGKEKPVSFPEFRDMVRLAVRRADPAARVENNETGLNLALPGKPTQACNLRNLYKEYQNSPKNREMLVKRWIDTLLVDVPEHGWLDAQTTLRPTLKNAEYVNLARRQMQKSHTPDDLPHEPFTGELSVIIMRDLPGTAVAVTRIQLEAWGVTFEEAMRVAVNNMNMLSFPSVTNTLTAGGGKKEHQEEVGLVMEGDHLTATWLIIERFRDYLYHRLLGDYVVMVPVRNRMVVIRADEPGLLTQVQQTNRNFAMQAHTLTSQVFHVSGSQTGGIVTVHNPGLNVEKAVLDPNSMFAKGNTAALPTGGIQPHMPGQAPVPGGPMVRPGPVDLSAWGGLSESTEDEPPQKPTKGGKK